LSVSLSTEDAAGRARATSQQEAFGRTRTTVSLQGSHLSAASSPGTSNAIAVAVAAACRGPLWPTQFPRPSLAHPARTRVVRPPQDLLGRATASLPPSFVQEDQPAHVPLTHCDSRTSPAPPCLLQRDFAGFADHNRDSITHYTALRLFPFTLHRLRS
jgi:hypothetical protein